MNYKKISELTEVNNHTEARIEIAKELMKKTKDDYYVKIFEAIKQIQDKEKHLPMDLYSYRSKKTNDLIEAVEIVFGEEVLKEVKGCI